MLLTDDLFHLRNYSFIIGFIHGNDILYKKWRIIWNSDECKYLYEKVDEAESGLQARRTFIFMM